MLLRGILTIIIHKADPGSLKKEDDDSPHGNSVSFISMEDPDGQNVYSMTTDDLH